MIFKQKGITLIALVITIIVLLILAGVSIATLTGDNGLLTKTQEAKEQNEYAKEDDLRRLTQAEAATHLTNEDYYDINGDKAVIPAGFAVSQVDGENIIDDGLVIIDEDGNEFVWIPVENYSEFIRQDFGIQNIPSSNFISESTEDNKYYEPTPETTAETSEQIKKEIKEMYQSVKDNHGFYISRFEAGTTDTTNSIGKRGKVISKKNSNIYNNIMWSNSLSDETGGAVEVARMMYPGHSTLCYGVQWDAVLRWISKDDTNKKYLQDSTGKGNYLDEDDTNNPAITGSNEDYKIKNIYDMAGNVWEWTMETTGKDRKVYRGGNYNFNGNERPISHRISVSPTSYDYYIGFRITLYL